MESQIDPHETCPAQNIIKLINKLVVDEALIAAPKLINIVITPLVRLMSNSLSWLKAPWLLILHVIELEHAETYYGCFAIPCR